LAVWNRVGEQTQFYAKTIASIGDAVTHYRVELIRLIATMSLGTGALALIGGWPRAAIALSFLLGASHYVYDSAAQMADVPLGAYFLASLVLYTLWMRDPNRRGLALLALRTRRMGA